MAVMREISLRWAFFALAEPVDPGRRVELVAARSFASSILNGPRSRATLSAHNGISSEYVDQGATKHRASTQLKYMCFGGGADGQARGLDGSKRMVGKGR
jgi:hypothetical protein